MHDNVSSVAIILDELSLGQDHKDLLAELNRIESQLNDRLDAHDLNIDTNLAQHDTDLKNQVTQHDTDLKTDLNNHDINIDVDLDGHVNPDPFEVTLQTCITLGADAGIQGGLSIAREGLLEASLGIDAYGNGASVEVNQPLRGELAGSLGGSLAINTEACYEGVRALYNGVPSPQGLGAHSVGTAHTNEEVALIGAYNTAAFGLQTGLIATTDAVGLAVEGVATAVDAVQALATDASFNLVDPGAILDASGPFVDLLLSMPMASQLDFNIEAALGPVLNPCGTGGIIRDLGSSAATVCNELDTRLEFTLNIVNGIPGQITDLFNGVLTFATLTTNNFIGEANKAVDAVCEPLQSLITGVNAFSLGPIVVPDIVTPRASLFGPLFINFGISGMSVPGIDVHIGHGEICDPTGVLGCAHVHLFQGSTPDISVPGFSLNFTIPEFFVPSITIPTPQLLPLVQPFNFPLGGITSCPNIPTLPAPTLLPPPNL